MAKSSALSLLHVPFINRNLLNASTSHSTEIDSGLQSRETMSRRCRENLFSCVKRPKAEKNLKWSIFVVYMMITPCRQNNVTHIIRQIANRRSTRLKFTALVKYKILQHVSRYGSSYGPRRQWYWRSKRSPGPDSVCVLHASFSLYTRCCSPFHISTHIDKIHVHERPCHSLCTGKGNELFVWIPMSDLCV